MWNSRLNRNEGFVFTMVSVLVGLGIAARMGFRVKEYISNSSMSSLIIGGATSQIMGFIMFWTLFYSSSSTEFGFRDGW